MKMNDYFVQKFLEKLESFLSSECDDYDIEFSIMPYDEAYSGKLYTILKRHEQSVDLIFRYQLFRYQPEYNDIEMCLYEDHYEIVREYDWTVRYFWMKVSPYLFPIKE